MKFYLTKKGLYHECPIAEPRYLCWGYSFKDGKLTCQAACGFEIDGIYAIDLIWVKHRSDFYAIGDWAEFNTVGVQYALDPPSNAHLVEL